MPASIDYIRAVKTNVQRFLGEGSNVTTILLSYSELRVCQHGLFPRNQNESIAFPRRGFQQKIHTRRPAAQWKSRSVPPRTYTRQSAQPPHRMVSHDRNVHVHHDLARGVDGVNGADLYG